MSGSRTVLKIITAILIIIAVLEIALGILLIVGSSLPELASQFVNIGNQVYSTSEGALASGIIVIISGVFYLIIGSLGWRGASRPSKIGPFFWLAVIGSVLSVVNLIAEIVGGTIAPNSIISTIIVVLCAILANNIRNHSKRAYTKKEGE